LQINIPFVKGLEQIPTFAKFMKELLTKKRSFIDEKTIKLEVGCSVIIQKSLPSKSKDPRSFNILVDISVLSVDRVLLDLGASIHLLSLAILTNFNKLSSHIQPITIQTTLLSLHFSLKSTSST